MSLDIYLISDTVVKRDPAIFIRENGQTIEISREEWDERYPSCEPVMTGYSEDNCVYKANITYNLAPMAVKAGVYEYLWRPAENGIRVAAQLIIPLVQGIKLMYEDPEQFKALNPQNNWGSYDDFVPWLLRYLEAC